MSGIGHNSGAEDDIFSVSDEELGSGDASAEQLRQYIERVERLEEEKKALSEDIRDVYAEAKAVGFDPKMMRKIVTLRKMKPEDRREMEMVLETYKSALGME